MAGFQVATPEGAYAYSHQLLDAEPEAGEHLAYLAFQPLFQHHAGAAGRKAGNIFGLGLAFGDTHALEQLDEHAAVECLVERDPVFLFHSAAGVGQVLAHAAVVGEDEQPLAVGIQPTHVVGMAVFGGQQVIDGADGPLCLPAAYVATRFVEQDDHLFLRYGAAAIHFHKVCGHDTQARGVYGLAVHFYSTFGNEAVCGPSALVATHGQEFVQAYAPLGGSGVAIILRHSKWKENKADKRSPAVATTGGSRKCEYPLVRG